MDNAQKAIMIGVGLFITIIIISAVMLITSAGTDMVNDSTDQLGNISSSLKAQLTSRYDETTLTGSQVIAAIKSYYTTEGMVLVVNNGSGTEAKYYKNYGTVKAPSNTDYQDSGATPISQIVEWDSSTLQYKYSIGKLSDTTATEHYVAPNAKYKAHLIKISDAVVGLYFKAK